MIQLPPLTQYLLETSICLTVIYIVYKLLFQKNTFFQLNRIYLLTGAAFSFLVPALHFTWQKEEIEVLIPMVYGSESIIVGINESLDQIAPWFSITIGQFILIIYGIGVLFFGYRFLNKLYKLYKITQYNPREKKDGILTLHTEETDTSSFFNWLFFNPRHQHDDSQLILEHELVHIRQWHSADVMMMEILVILNWFNPIIHLYNRSLRETHEFIADQIVASMAHSTYDYAKLLVKEVGKSINPALTNTFASLIKKRLIMLSTKNSRKWKGLYYLAVIPVCLFLITLFSFNLVDSVSGIEELNEKVEEMIDEPILAKLETKSGESTNENLVATTKVSEEIEDPIFKKVGSNYIFVIPNIETQKNNKVSVFSKFGEKVLDEENYQNNWDATSLEHGTYFYVLKLGDENFQGYVEKEKNQEDLIPEYNIIQSDSLPKGKIFKTVDVMPTYGNCNTISNKDTRKKCSDEAIIDFISKNIKYPKEAGIQGIEGTTIIRFVVQKDGTLAFNEDISKVILRNPGGGCGEEAFRIIQKMGVWNPGKENGRNIPVEFTLPIKFQLMVDDKSTDSSSFSAVPPPPPPPPPPAASSAVLPPPPPPPPAPPAPFPIQPKNGVYKVVEHMPHFAGCEHIEDTNERKECSDEKIIAFINSNIKYPAEAAKEGIEGTAVVRFIVEKDGIITFDENMAKVILRNPGGGCGEEAHRVIAIMPKWIPGKQDGKAVKVKYTMPIKFQLADDEPVPLEESVPTGK